MRERTHREGGGGGARTPPVAYMEAITERYRRLGYEPYRWYRASEAPPFTPLRKPVAESRLGLLTTSGAYVPGQRGFHYRDDTSVRAIGAETPNERIHFAHVTENYLEDPRRDPGCIVPLAALRTLVSEGLLGELAPEALSVMGGVYSQRRVREEMIPEVHARFREQQVDAVLLVPM